MITFPLHLSSFPHMRESTASGVPRLQSEPIYWITYET